MLVEITSALALGKTALDITKQVVELLPDGPKKVEATAKLKEAEVKLKESQAKTAKGLGYKLCKCEYPPNIMLENEDGIFVCPNPKCKKELNPFGLG